MSEINEHITALIVAQLSGSASEAELEELHQWLTSDADNARIYTQVKYTYWSRPSQSSEEKRVDVLNRIKQRTEQPAEKQIPPAKPRVRRMFLYGAAAAIVVAFLAGWWFTQNENTTVQTAQIEKLCPRGQKVHFNLPDGSEVWLNADSKLRFPETFAADVRKLSLEGEAFFKVKRNTSKPFIVATQNALIEVLGTSFNINARSSDKFTKTSVVSGSVKVSDKSQSKSVTLVKNQQVEVTTAGEVGNVTEINAEELTGWTSNRMFFDNVSFAEVVKELERWYDVEVVVNDPAILQKQVRAKFENPSLNQILEYIASVNNFSFEIEDSKVVIGGVE